MINRRFLFVTLLLISLLFVFNNVSLYKIITLPNDFYASYEEISQSNKDKDFGRLVDISFKEGDIATASGKVESGEITFKLFGFIPIKKTTVKILPEEEVYIGGCPIGLSVQTDGAVVISNSMVVPESAKIIKNQYFANGDIIKEINDKEVHSVDDLVKALELLQNDRVTIKYQSNNQNKEKNIDLIKDSNGRYKIGLWVKDNFSGVGTLTFVSKNGDNHKFGALGHPITNGNNENIIPVSEGEIYSCSLVDIAKGEKNNPGELRCVFVQKNKKGTFEKNTQVGIFGSIDNMEDLVDQNRTAFLGGRLSVKPGNAKIVSSISGILEEYEIEIIKASYQNKSADKSLVFRVKDKRLLDLTGGIVQGMSGSPIMQDGKIIGAVTHVFVSDPTMGFGVYSDWMLEQFD